MRNKKSLVFITIIMLLMISVMMVACIPEDGGEPSDKPVDPPDKPIVPPVDPPVVLVPELIFGEGGAIIEGILEPNKSVTAKANVLGKNYNMKFVASIINVKVNWVKGENKGITRNYTDSVTIAKIAVLTTDINNLVMNAQTLVTFIFTMPDTDDETFANAKFVFTVKLVGVIAA